MMTRFPEENPAAQTFFCKIGEINCDRDDGKMTVNARLDQFPVDAFLVAHKAKIVV